MIKERFTLTLQYEMEIDTETGEIVKTTLLKRSVEKEAKPLSSDKPQLSLLENKYMLTDTAVALLGISVGDKLDIQYSMDGSGYVPMLCIGEGNKLTKGLTVACRGSKNTELRKFGTIFDIEKLDNGRFLLKGDAVIEQPTTSDDIELPDDLDDLVIEDEFEVNKSMFQF